MRRTTLFSLLALFSASALALASSSQISAKASAAIQATKSVQASATTQGTQATKSVQARAAIQESSLAAKPSVSYRTTPSDTVSLNRGWYFRHDDPATAAKPTASQSPEAKSPAPASIPSSAAKAIPTLLQAQTEGWSQVSIPHDFQISQPWVAPEASERPDESDAGANIRSRLSSRGFKEMGGGWYVRSFSPDPQQRGKRVLLDFEGLIYYGDVYLNGTRIGGTDYGYVGFEIDITDKVSFGKPNTLAVYAHTGEAMNSRWYTGGGLFRDVHLVYTDPILHFLRHPLAITTKANKTVSITAGIQCHSRQDSLGIKIRITAPDGSIVRDETLKVKRNRNYRLGQELKLPDFDIPNPQLWSCETPNLYTATIELLREDGSSAARRSERFGIRTIEFVPGTGLKLNGEKLLLKGYANHHDLGALGAAAYPRAIEKRIQLIKQFGMNHIRTSHNPYSKSFLDLCDRYGILVVDELYDKWNDQYVGAGRAPFVQLWPEHLKEWITRDRNHPCVIMWSFGNELQSYSDTPYNDFGVTMYHLMNTLAKRYDPSRKTTVAMHPRYRNWDTNDLPCDLAMQTEVQSYNYRYMYFPGDYAKFPWMTFYQSEASTSAMGENWYAMDLDKVIGLAYWGAIDYLGESQGWPAKGWAQGVIDISLEPKPKAYYMKSFFVEDEPLVHIAITERKGDLMWNGIQTGNDGQSDHWNRRPGSTLSIITYTNADEVELIVNGRSYGRKTNPKSDPKMRNQIHWEGISYRDGYCEAIARSGGNIVARHKIETTGKPVRLSLEADNPSWTADATDLQHIRVVAVDSKGRRVQTAEGEISFNIEGDATIAALTSGDHNSNELHTATTRRLYNGTCQAILRAGTEPGTVTLTATMPGLKPAKLSLTTLPQVPNKGLSRHDFFYAGESTKLQMYKVQGGKITWAYHDTEGKGEISDAVLMSDGNILYAHQYGIKEINSQGQILWSYDVPEGYEVHSARPIGKNHIVFVQCGKPMSAVVMEIPSKKIVREFPLPYSNPGKHSQNRSIHLSSSGTLLVAAMDSRTLYEFDSKGTQLNAWPIPNLWGVTELPNGNILATSSKGTATEFNRGGKTVWQYTWPSDRYPQPRTQKSYRLPSGNTIMGNWFNEWGGVQIDPANPPVQMIEVNPEGEIVWELNSWTAPANLGPSTTFQLLSEPVDRTKLYFGEFK